MVCLIFLRSRHASEEDSYFDITTSSCVLCSLGVVDGENACVIAEGKPCGTASECDKRCINGQRVAHWCEW